MIRWSEGPQAFSLSGLGTVLSPRVQRLCIPGWPSPRADLSPSSSPSMATPGRLPRSQGIVTDQPATGQSQALTSQASRLLAKVSEPLLLPTWSMKTVCMWVRCFHQPQTSVLCLHED